MKVIYLSAPYTTGPDPVEKRQADIDQATALLMKQHHDIFIYSPITYQRRIKDVWKENGTWEFWGPRDGEMVSRSDEVWILCLNNWNNSRGVNFEIKKAGACGKPVRYFSVGYVDGFVVEVNEIPVEVAHA